MDQIGLLGREHRRIAAMARELAAMVSAHAPPEPVRFLHFRREFGRTLTCHLKREDWVVYPRLLANDRADVREAAGRHCAESAAFSAAFSDYSRHWTSLRIVGDWPGFRAETRAMLASLEKRIHVEENHLYPLLGSHGAAVPLKRAG